MKKFTFLLVAALMAVGANAQWGTCEIGEYGNYDLETGTWVNEVPANNKMVTLAIKVTNTAALSWLAESQYNTLALQDFRLAPNGAAVEGSKKSFRLERQGVSNVYAINVVLKQLWADYVLSNYYEGQDNIINAHSGLGKAWAGGNGSTPEWGYEAFGYCHIGFGAAVGADAPAINCGWEAGGTYEVPGIARPSLVASGDCGIGAGTESPFEQEPDNVEYFNLQGIKIQGEPKEGLYIAVPYYNGVRGTAQKVLLRK